MAFDGKQKLDARRQALKDWRGLDVEAFKRAQSINARSLGQMIPKILTDLKLDQRLADTEVFKAWNLLMDPNLVAHAQPAALNKGTLFINVDSSVWLNEIVRYRRSEILERLQHAFGKETVAKISFRVMG